METTAKTTITVEATVNAPVEKVWESWSLPEHITKWCSPSNDWHAPYADNDPRTGGKFKTTMAAKDGSFSFDFGGTYTDVKENRFMAYTIDDGREVSVTFEDRDGVTKITETFEPEAINSLEMQQGGWQAILNNFKKYTEGL